MSHGLVANYPEAIFYGQSEEHGNLDLTDCPERPKVGDKVMVIPNHCCTTTNMHDLIYGVRNGVVVETFQVAARGKLI
jgi:D-serine deaminase-like pyridoxal phosphate-dependent protein